MRIRENLGGGEPSRCGLCCMCAGRFSPVSSQELMGIGKMFLVFQRSNKFMIVRGIPKKPNPSSGRDCCPAARRILGD